MSSDPHFLDPALGYLSLGLLDDAQAELDSLPPELRTTAPVLEARISIYHEMCNWECARMIAEAMAMKAPEEPAWWIHWAYSLRREKNVQEARGVLWQAVQIHPSCANIVYNLACYACVLGEPEEARKLLARAVALDGHFRRLAPEDPDLEPLFKSETPS